MADIYSRPARYRDYKETIELLRGKARKLGIRGSSIREEVSKLESVAKVLEEVRPGEFLVFEDTGNDVMPVQMGIYEGISDSLDLKINLKNPAYIIKNPTGEYNLRNNREELLFYEIVVDSIRRNIGGKSTIPTIHRDLKESGNGHTANEILQKYGFSIEQYRELYPD